MFYFKKKLFLIFNVSYLCDTITSSRLLDTWLLRTFYVSNKRDSLYVSKFNNFVISIFPLTSVFCKYLLGSNLSEFKSTSSLVYLSATTVSVINLLFFNFLNLWNRWQSCSFYCFYIQDYQLEF